MSNIRRSWATAIDSKGFRGPPRVSVRKGHGKSGGMIRSKEEGAHCKGSIASETGASYARCVPEILGILSFTDLNIKVRGHPF